MTVSSDQVQQLRKDTGAGIMDAKRALEEAKGDAAQAKRILTEKGLTKAAKKSERETAEGVVHSYIHGDGRIGVLLELLCETDFVARGKDFRTLAQDLAMQAAASEADSVEELLEEPFIKDPAQKVEAVVTAAIAKLGENIRFTRFVRYRLGDGA